MISVSLQEIIKDLNADCSQSLDVTPTGISIDSRTLKPGDIFFAIKGENQDGHKYLDSAIKNGASAIVVQDLYQSETCPKLLVSDTTQALLSFGLCLRKKMKTTQVLAISGSNGKTSTKDLLTTILSTAGKTVSSQKSYNNCFGVPLTLAKVEEDTEFLVLELGSNHPGELLSLYKYCLPDIAGITLVAQSHLEGFGTIDKVAKEKFSFFGPGLCKSLVYNLDNHPSLQQVKDLFIEKKSVGSSDLADFTTKLLEQSENGLSFTFNNDKFFMPVLGKHNVQNVGIALGLAKIVLKNKFNEKKIKIALAHFHLPMQRLNKKVVANGVIILDDSYNSNPTSLSSAIETLKSIKTNARKWVLLGEMKELGESTLKQHENCGKHLLNADIYGGIGYGDMGKVLLSELAKNGAHVSNFETIEDCVQFLKENLKKDDWLLIKASRSVRLERVIDCLQ